VVGYRRYGSEAALADNAIMHLCNVYVAINKDLKKEKELSDRHRKEMNKEKKKLSTDGHSATDEMANFIFCQMEQGVF
jgi:arginyl-tRNA synthetase